MSREVLLDFPNPLPESAFSQGAYRSAPPRVPLASPRDLQHSPHFLGSGAASPSASFSPAFPASFPGPLASPHGEYANAQQPGHRHGAHNRVRDP